MNKIPVPSPTSGESRDKFISRCMSRLSKVDSDKSQDQRSAMCYSAWRSKGDKGERGGDRGGSHNRPLNNSIRYMMPLMESVIINEKNTSKAVIHGVAISATTSRNGVEYTVEGLEKNESLIGMNIGLGHSGNPADNVGKIIASTWDPVSKSRRYKAEVFNTARYPDAIDMVKNGLWQFVSIEAIPKNAKMDKKNKKLVVNDLEFIGLDFVKSPGIPQASAGLAGESFGNALYEALQKEIFEEVEENMPEEEKEQPEAEEVEEKSTPKVIEKVVEKTDKKVLELLENQNKILEKLKEKVTKLEEKKEEKLEEESKAVMEESEKKPLVESAKLSSEKVPSSVKKDTLVFENIEGNMASFWVMPDYESRRGA